MRSSGGGAQRLSADCHRSQYGYPFRVSLGLALENLTVL